jgi:hypothetical protein
VSIEELEAVATELDSAPGVGIDQFVTRGTKELYNCLHGHSR